MTEWLICAGVIVAFLFLMPMAVRSSRKSRRLRGGSAAIGDVLTGVFDPAKKVSIEQIQRQREIGDHEAGQAGDPPGT